LSTEPARELYNRAADSYQLRSIHESADPALLAELHGKLAALAECSGASCLEAEN
jgi:N-acetylglucosamine-6-sulfatase